MANWDNIEKQYQDVIEQFPSIQLIDNKIYHFRLPLLNQVSLEVNFESYPRKPDIVLVKPSGEQYDKIQNQVPTLKRWKRRDPGNIAEVIQEILMIIESMKSEEIMIKKELMNGLFALCQEQHPNEILGFLRVEGGVVSEFILPPGASTNERSGIFSPRRMGIDHSIRGSVHSHPTGNPFPSQADLRGVFRKKEFNFIIASPYNSYSCVKCFDQLGNELKFRTV
ncbi:MAG: Mov34/MPN/PAD-1 family protein [Promethearchaeia archaeon]